MAKAFGAARVAATGEVRFRYNLLRRETTQAQCEGDSDVRWGMLVGAASGMAAMVMSAAGQLPAAPDGIGLASAHAAAVRELSSPEAWGGARTGQEQTLSDRVVSYQIRARLDPKLHTVEGSEVLTWRNRSRQPVRAVYLHLYLNAFEGPGSTYATEGRVPGFSQRDEVGTHDGEWGHVELKKVSQAQASVPWQFVHPDGGPQTDHTVVRLDLPEAVAPGASTTLNIAFADQLPRVLARSGYFGSFHLIAQWYPKIGVLELPGERGAKQVQWNVHEYHIDSEFYADYGSFDVRLTVPTDYTVGATGEEQGTPEQAGGMSTYHFQQADVHDFAWTADNRTAKPVEGEYHGEGSPAVKVKVLFPPEYAQDGPVALQAALDALAYFSRTLGPYPYKTVTVVIPPFNAEGAAGMEYPTFFTSDHYSNPRRDRLGGPQLDFVTIHEFGHGYFYGILGSNEFEEPMLDEGLNEFWDMRMLADAKERMIFSPDWMVAIGIAPSATGFEYERVPAMVADPQDGTGANSWDRYSTFSYGSVYFRSAILMHDLAWAVGQKNLERAFKLYYERWKFRHPSIADFREAMAEGTGQRALVEKLFDEEVYSANKEDDAIDSFVSTEEVPGPGTSYLDGKWVEVTTEQADKKEKETRAAWKKDHPKPAEGTGPYPYHTILVLVRRGVAMPKKVVVKFADGSSESMQWSSELRWQRYEWFKPVKAVSAQIDPELYHFLNAGVIDNSRTLDAHKDASRKFGSYLDTAIQAALSLVAAL
jgi:hypothetical protein